MDAQPAGPDPESVLAAVRALEGFPARERRLRKFRSEFTEALHERFREEALSALREDPRDAADLARLGARVAAEIDDEEGRVACLSAWAQAAITQGEFKTALRALDSARRNGSVRAGDARVAELQTLRVQALTHLERYADAREAAALALSAHERAGNSNGMAWVELNLAELAFREDRPRDALRHFARVERLIPLDDKPRLRAAMASNRANSLEARNRFRAAARQFAIARGLFEEEGCAHTVAQVDYNAAYAEGLRGRYEDALRCYARTAEEFEALGDQRHLAHVDLDRAEIHLHLNLPDTAAKLAASAEARFKKLRLSKERAQAWHLQGRAAQIAGDPGAADGHYARAARQFGRLGLPERRFGCLVQRAQIARTTRSPREARRHLTRAEKLLRESEVNPVTAASAELERAWLDVAGGDGEEALRRCGVVLAACRRVHAPCLHIEVNRIRGAALRLEGDLAEAIDAYELAIDHLERYRGGVPPDEYMAAFLAGRTELYAEIVDLLVETGQDVQALEFVERARSRALVDLLADRHARSTTPRADKTLTARADHLRERLTAVYGRLFRATGEPGARSARSIRMARRQARDLEREIVELVRNQRLSDPESASLDAVAVPDLAAIRGRLEPDTALVEYYLTASKLFTFVVTRDSVHVTRQPATARHLRFLLEQFHFQLAKHERPFVAAPELVLRATRSTLGQLAKVVLGPIRDQLRARRLVVVPHGLLHHLPSHGSAWNGRFEVVYAPSAAVYDFCSRRRRMARGRPSVFALPDDVAPQIEFEAARVADRLGSDRVYLRDDATFARLAAEAKRSRIVHIATHGMFRHQQPMLSSIRLADRWANLYDLYGMEVRSELLVLSTCESGTADVTAGDEILGLTRGFLYAGARALMTSQWRVDDAVTTAFMDRFYLALTELGDPAAAHRRAMAEIRAKHPHPYYWAAFFLTGRPVAHESRSTLPAQPASAVDPTRSEGRPAAVLQRS
jgi:tetratricopeptide (TPR) repeat protein